MKPLTRPIFLTRESALVRHTAPSKNVLRINILKSYLGLHDLPAALIQSTNDLLSLSALRV
jgi:hypothetical protein